MDCFVNEKDYILLDNDKYTFFVLKRLLGGENKLLLTDHERLIICFPVSLIPYGFGTRMIWRKRSWKERMQYARSMAFLMVTIDLT